MLNYMKTGRPSFSSYNINISNYWDRFDWYTDDLREILMEKYADNRYIKQGESLTKLK